MPDLDQLTAKNKESKDTLKRFSAACAALQDGANPISPAIFSTLPQAIAICYMVMVFGLEAVVRLCKCERVIPQSLTDAQRRDVLERCTGLPKERVQQLQQLIHCQPHLWDALGWDEGNLCILEPACNVHALIIYSLY